VRWLAGLSGGAAGCEDGFALPLGGSLPRRCISSIVAACNKSSSPSLRCPTALFKSLGRTCRGDTRLFTALATTREDEGGFSDGERASRSDGGENRSGVVGRVRAAVIFRPQAKSNAPLETSSCRDASRPIPVRCRCKRPWRGCEEPGHRDSPLGCRARLEIALAARREGFRSLGKSHALLGYLTLREAYGNVRHRLIVGWISGRSRLPHNRCHSPFGSRCSGSLALQLERHRSRSEWLRKHIHPIVSKSWFAALAQQLIHELAFIDPIDQAFSPPSDGRAFHRWADTLQCRWSSP